MLHHDVALVMGSGWVPAADRLGAATADIDVDDAARVSRRRRSSGMPAGSARSRSATSGRWCSSGRTHLYEGRGVAAAVHGVRTAVAAGARLVVLTNAAGGLRQGMAVGDPVLISDHLNLTATSPITGANFVDLTDLYSPRLRAAGAGDRPDR